MSCIAVSILIKLWKLSPCKDGNSFFSNEEGVIGGVEVPLVLTLAVPTAVADMEPFGVEVPPFANVAEELEVKVPVIALKAIVLP